MSAALMQWLHKCTFVPPLLHLPNAAQPAKPPESKQGQPAPRHHRLNPDPGTHLIGVVIKRQE